MTIVFAAFSLLFALGLLGLPKRWSLPSKDFLSREITAGVNGYFILVVFLSHLRGYIPQETFGPLDEGYLRVIGYLGQLVVATFLFYSGYGIMESIKRKPGYIDALPRRRIVPFLQDVWIALVLYAAIMIFHGSIPPVEQVILSMVGFKNLGNSSWYIFAILCMWAATYLSFKLCGSRGRGIPAVLLVWLLALAYGLVLQRDGQVTTFYDTILCYPAGMSFSLVADAIRPSLRGVAGKVAALVVAAVLLVAFLRLHVICKERALYFNLMAIVFALIIACCSVWVGHVGKPFVWCGKNLFYLYIYQRIPMSLLRPALRWGTLAYALVCLVALMLLVVLMQRVHRAVKSFLAPE